jgi:cell division protein FtsI (penicillin-binding protein 3)
MNRPRFRPVASSAPIGPAATALRIDRLGLGLALGMTLALSVMLGRIALLQLAPTPALRQNIQQRMTYRGVTAMRGDITDSRGRLLATTRLGYRAFVDPLHLPDPPDEAIVTLSEAIGVPVDTLGERIIKFTAVNAALQAGIPEPRPQTEAEIREELVQGILRRLGLGEDDIEQPSNIDGAALPGEPAAGDTIKGLIRYVRVSDILTDEQVERVRAEKIPGVHLERREVREYPGGDIVASIIGKVGAEEKGLMGSEQRLEPVLQGKDGTVGYVRDSFGRPLWIEVGQIRPAERGRDVRLSIDLELQRLAAEELARGIEDADACGGRLVMLDPSSGQVLAMVDLVRDVPGLVEFPWQPINQPNWSPPGGRPRYKTLGEDKGRKIHPALGRNRCVEDAYEPGSTFKPFVWATITELDLARTDEVFDTEGGRWTPYKGRYIEDVVKRATMTWTDVLVNSSNIGMIKAAQRLSHEQLHEALARFGFGRRTNLGLPGESTGIITGLKSWSKYTQTSVAFGHEVAVTPVQMARAYTAFARAGEDAGTIIPIRLFAEEESRPDGATVKRILPAPTAILTRQTMALVAEKLEERMSHGKAGESGWRYTMFGKSGTAEIPLGKAPAGFRRPRGSSGYYDDQYNSSFIAGAPVEAPRLIVVVVIDDPGPSRIRNRTHYGSAVAGPVVRRVLDRALTYLGVPPSPASVAQPDRLVQAEPN